MDYVQIALVLPSGDKRDWLLAELSEMGFESFQEEDDQLIVFHPQADWDQGMLAISFRDLAEQQNLSWSVATIGAQNWNALWESNFSPIRVGDFCGIRADFHPPQTNIQYEIVINPEMAFGTGHHATTHMMIELMSGIVFTQKKVLDYGTGTGVLALLASFLGSVIIDAVDIEKAAFENTQKNAQRNQVDNIRVIHGTLESVVDAGYQIILANINRNVILDTLPALRNKIEANGILLVSGILQQDQEQVEQAAIQAGFILKGQLVRNGCVGMVFSCA
ncbi:MAG: 50S ribosomal protein L11 methyltransferase [Saprospiraceae bacterium]|nr:50S ribosomal protein L11 methyltransferase [Saprospiraceae bacterium]